MTAIPPARRQGGCASLGGSRVGQIQARTPRRAFVTAPAAAAAGFESFGVVARISVAFLGLSWMALESAGREVPVARADNGAGILK